MPAPTQAVLELSGSLNVLHRAPGVAAPLPARAAGSRKKAKRTRQQRDRARSHVARAVIAPPQKQAPYEVPPFEAWNTGSPIKKRTDIKTILLLGAGPIVIGQVDAAAAVSAAREYTLT